MVNAQFLLDEIGLRHDAAGDAQSQCYDRVPDTLEDHAALFQFQTADEATGFAAGREVFLQCGKSRRQARAPSVEGELTIAAKS